MPSDKFKFSAKNGVAPVIKKFYNSHKKLLGKTSTPIKPERKIKKENVSKINRNPIGENQHVYENLTYSLNREKSASFSEEVFAGVNLSLSSLNLDGESSFCLDSRSESQAYSSDCSTLTNYEENSISSVDCLTPTSDLPVSVLENKNEDFKKTAENVTIIEVDDVKDKLKTAIDNFDRILSEYTSPIKLANAKPKLQKSKTCSIIESKCILKKTLSESNTAEATFKSLNLTQITTKSLCHLDREVEGVDCHTQKFLDEMDFWKTSSAKMKDFPTSKVVEDEQPIKVKDVVKRLNSLSGDEEKKSVISNKKIVNNKQLSRKKSDVKPPLQKSSSGGRKPILKVNKIEKLASKSSSLIPRAVSCYDVSGINKKPISSKIPVKTNLNKTYPSTPSNLNNFLDSTMRCTAVKYEEKCQSVQNLAAKINQNDGKIGFAPRKSINPDLERTVSCQNLSRTPRIVSEDLTRNNSPQKIDTKRNLTGNHSSGEPVKKLGYNVKNDGKTGGSSSDIQKDLRCAKIEIPEAKRKLVRNLTYNKSNMRGNRSKSDLLTGEDEVKKDLQDTFGIKKLSVDAIFCEFQPQKKKQIHTLKKNALKRTDTYNKNYRITEFQAIDTIEKNLKTAEEFFVKTNLTSCEILDASSYSKANCVSNLDHPLASDVGKVDIREDATKTNTKNKDYLSDDNSDDSGNISNELELEYEEVAASSPTSFAKITNDEDKIFFRSGVLTQLESQRDEKLAGMVVSLQAHCRGYLARKKLSQRKLQDLAVRCIQRNVRKFILVRDWPWWRLLVRVTPLLNVHRTEEELKMKTEELELLKTKLEKLESERTNLKHHNDKLEAKLSEMTADFAEEHSTSTLAAERLDAETADRIRLERELGDVQQKNKELQNASERLEMELLYARSELNGISEDDEDPDGEAVYKQRYERAMRELEFTKRRLQQQHEDDLEQLVGLKKQLEKKLTDAYEEVEEQRQVVGQWKRKVQKLNGEMNDLKLLLEEQNARNNLLEKKQRKFDSELQLLQDELKKEKQARDRLSREKEVITAEKFTLESNVADVRLELDLKEEKLILLQKDLDELTYGGKTEEEVMLLRKQKIDCERRLHDQEEELDELAGQVQLLEQAKLKLEMSLEQQRKTAKKETQQHDEELEEVRCNAQKKVKALEAQLENEHDERTILLREKHELERRLTAALESDRSEKACDEAVLQRLKRDLKRTKALLRDTQAQLERQKAENPSKTLIRQFKNQIEDLECARSAAVKTKQILEAELSETQAQLDEVVRHKNDLEEKSNTVNREKADLQLQVEENEEELAEVLKKYKTTIQQMSLDQLALQEQVSLVGELEAERNSLKEQLVELTSKLDSLENAGDASSNILVKRTELKVKELESKLDLEQTTRTRLEVQISRLKETMEKLQNDLVSSRTKEQNAQDQIRKLQRSLRELRDQHNSTLTKESESLLKRKELEKRYEALEAESSTVRTDLRLALKRIEDLQAVIQNDLEDSTENSDSEHDSYSSDDSVNTFLANHKINTKSNSMQFDNQRRLSSTSRSSTSSNLTKDSSYA